VLYTKTVDAVLIYLLGAVCVGGLAIGAVGSIVMFALFALRVVK